MENVNAVKSPIVPGCRLSKEASGEGVNPTSYKQMVGSLMYLTAIRPDIMFSVCLIIRYMDNTTMMHFQAVKKVLRYLKGTVDFGILYSRQGKKELTAFTDSYYAGDLDDRKSVSGYVFMLGTSAI